MTSSSFAGFVANNEAGNSFIKDVRALLKGKDVVVKLFARNSNRKQYAKNRMQHIRFRQNLPVQFAAHYGTYIYRDHKKSNNYDPSIIVHAKVVFDTVRKIYEMNGVKINP